MVNVDAKIASKVIANRIKCCLPGIIHHNQTGFIKDSFIGETARSILDIIDHTEHSELPGMMIFIDFENAFDSIEWCFLYKCLEAFNFGSEFIKWVKTGADLGGAEGAAAPPFSSSEIYFLSKYTIIL